jgi:hypothetical protein
MMDKLKVIGVGCYGKPETVSRFITKKVSGYNSEKGFKPEPTSISGFYLGLDNQVLKLSVFSKRNGRHQVVDNFSLLFEP